MIIFFLFFFIGFFITLIKTEYALYLVLFLIPYSKFDITRFGVNYAVLFGLFIGLLARKALKDDFSFSQWKDNKKILSLLLYPFLISILFSFVPFNMNDIEFAARDDLSKSLIIFTVSYFSSFLFLIILLEKMGRSDFFFKSSIAFVSSIFLLFIPWLSFKFNIHVPTFLQRRISFGDTFYGGIGSDLRFAGFWGDYELTNEYSFIIFSLSVFLFLINKQRKRRVFFLLSGSTALLIALSTGTRSIILMLTIFFIIIVIIYFIKTKVSVSKKIASFFVILLILIGIYNIILENDILIERFTETISIFESSRTLANIETLELLVNRQYSTTYLDILEVGNLVGIGPYAVTGIRGSRMVYHCLYYNIVIVFGIVGLIFFLIFWKTLLRKLWDLIRLKNDRLAVILFSLFLAIILDQIKINYLRTNSHMLTWSFIYAVIIYYTQVNEKIGGKIN